MRNASLNSTACESEDITTVIGHLITQAERKKHRRYLACGCVTCHNRAAEIDAWLNGDALSIPDEARLLVTDNRPKPIGHGTAWLCMNCLHKVPRSSERCNHCNARRKNSRL